MDVSSKLTMYDFLAMVIPGFLVLLLFACIVGWLPLNIDITDTWFIVFLVIVSYLIGLLWHKISELFFEKIGFRNNPAQIKKIAEKEDKGLDNVFFGKGADEIILEKYYTAYYLLMEKNCLNSIPILEAQVAFIKNLTPLIGLYILVLLHCDNEIYIFIKSIIGMGNTLPLIILLLIMMIGLTIVLPTLQNKIYLLVWEGNKYLK